METITTYLNGSFTGYEVLGMALIGGWLLFNAGFCAGTVWKGMFSEPRQSARPGYIELSGDEYHAVRCTMRSPEDVARRAGAV